MQPKRVMTEDDSQQFTEAPRRLLIANESMRVAEPAPSPEAKGDERLSVFWRVFGGTILSISALVAITVYQSLASAIHEVRGDVGRVREGQADYAKKDEFVSSRTKVWDKLQELQAMNAAVSVLGNRLTNLEGQLSEASKDRKELQAAVAGLIPVKERIAPLEEFRRVCELDHKDVATAVAGVASLKDRDAVQEKAIKDLDTDRRELAKELQMLRERLAKLEGQREMKPNGESEIRR